MVALHFSKELDAHNPNTPEWREDIGLVVTRLLSKVPPAPAGTQEKWRVGGQGRVRGLVFLSLRDQGISVSSAHPESSLLPEAKALSGRDSPQSLNNAAATILGIEE